MNTLSHNTVQPSCPFCDRSGQPCFEKSDFTVFECKNCNHRFCEPPTNQTHVEDVYSDEYFSGGGGGYNDYLGQQEMLVAHGKKYARLLKRHCSAETPTILDIGCAAGFLLKGFEEEGWRGVGIDANQTMVDYGKKQLGLDLRCQTIEKYAFNESERIDAAMMVQVLPHLSDPLAAIETVHKMLNEDGLVLIETWDYQSLTARAFRQSWHEYNPPSVLHWFSKSGLQSVLKESGFEIIKTGRPTKWISVGNGVSLIKHSLRTSTLGKIATLPLSVIPKSLKAPYFLDDVFWVLAKRKKR